MHALLALLASLLLTAASVASLPAAAAIEPDQALVVTWEPPEGALYSCVLRIAPLPMEPLGCAEGAIWTRSGSSVDGQLQVRPGDTLEVRSYDDEGEAIGYGQAIVLRLQPERLYLPLAYQSAAEQ